MGLNDTYLSDIIKGVVGLCPDNALSRLLRISYRMKLGYLSRPQKPSNLGDLGGKLGFFLGGAGSEAKRLFQMDL